MLRESYQTVYAKIVGSVAAPTAGFHFTQKLLKKLRDKGVQMEFVTLHVGLGTFAPVKKINIENHHIHSEYFELDSQTAERLNQAKSQGKRIIAVGTTTTRVLESCILNYAQKHGGAKPNHLRGELKLHLLPKRGNSNLFIFPPYQFKYINALITNFHLPESTLLALVCAFVSYPNSREKFTNFKSSLIGKAYLEAINNNYRFFSFGDACLIV